MESGSGGRVDAVKVKVRAASLMFDLVVGASDDDL